MNTVNWKVNSHQSIMDEKKLALHSLSDEKNVTKYQDSDKIPDGGVDTEATSVSDSTALYDYTGIYRLSTIFDESSLKSAQTGLLTMGGFIALQPITGDDYYVTLSVHQNSNKILTARLYIAQCMDYVSSNIDHEEIPYDDIIGIRDLKWINKEQKDDVDVISTSNSQNDIDEQERAENILVRILTECDMIRFVGEILVFEGPKGAIECITGYDD
jgi:hypothetical protein